MSMYQILVYIFSIWMCLCPTVRCKTNKTRIIGGVSTTIAKYPFAVSILSHGEHMCGGTLVANKWAVTASHCIVMATQCHMKIRNPKFYQILAGSTFVDKRKEIGQFRQCVYFANHPDYNPDDLNNDIAMIMVDKSFQMGAFVAIAKVSDYFGDEVEEDQQEAPSYRDLEPNPEDSAEYYTSEEKIKKEEDEFCTIVGWGMMGTDRRQLAMTLQSSMLDFIPREKCKEKLAGYDLPETDLCLKSTSLMGSCYGDSGGPVICQKNRVEAVVSGSVGDFDCAVPQLPYIFVRLAPYRPWMEEVMREPPPMSVGDVIESNKTICQFKAEGFAKEVMKHQWNDAGINFDGFVILILDICGFLVFLMF